MPRTRTYAHPPRPLDVARTGANNSLKLVRPASVARVASEFREMPGLLVTLAQAARLFDLPRDECCRVLAELQRDGVIELTADGCYRTPPGH